MHLKIGFACFVGLVLVGLTSCAGCCNGAEGRIPVGISMMPLSKAYAKNSINTTVFRVNAICSDANIQIASYYDEEGYVTFAKRKLSDSQWEITKSDFQCACNDAHNGIALAIDGDGYIHIVYDQHSSQLMYRKSESPYSFDFGERLVMTDSLSERNVTYPEFHRKRNGNLLFVYRSGSSGNGNCAVNEYDVKEKSWKRLQDRLIDGDGQRNAYWQSYSVGDTLYISWVWRESYKVETNHDMCYAFSNDGAMTWMDSDSRTYELPLNENNAEVIFAIPQNSDLINQTSMAVDNGGNPYIATYWRMQNDSIPQYRIISQAGNSWTAEEVYKRKTPFSLSGGGTKRIPIARPKLLIDKNNRGFFLFRDIERGEVVSLAYCDNIGQPSWKIMDLTDFPVGAWEPIVDMDRWKSSNILDIYIQKSYQGDGEKSIDTEGEMAYVMELSPVW